MNLDPFTKTWKNMNSDEKRKLKTYAKYLKENMKSGEFEDEMLLLCEYCVIHDLCITELPGD